MKDILTQYGALTIPAAILLHGLIAEGFAALKRRRAERYLRDVRGR